MQTETPEKIRVVDGEKLTPDEIEMYRGTAGIWQDVCRYMAKHEVMPAVTGITTVGPDATHVVSCERIATRDQGYATLALAAALYDPLPRNPRKEPETEPETEKRRITVMADLVFVDGPIPDPEPKPKPERKPGQYWSKETLPSADEIEEAADAGFTRIEAAEYFGLKSHVAYYWFPKLAPRAAWIDRRQKKSA